MGFRLLLKKLTRIASIVLFYVFLGISSYAQNPITFVITNIPSYTPDNDSLFLVSSLDNWTLSNKDKMFRLFPDGNYRLTIDVGDVQKFEYKINRGDWDKVEGNAWGDFIPNRRFTYHDSIFEVRLVVESWQDLHDNEYPPVEIIVISVPDNTPPDANIYIAGTFNDWMDNDPAYKMVRFNDGTYHGEIRAGIDSVEYKFTRGSWESIEGRWDGGMRSNRMYISHQSYNNQVVTEIKSWNDLSNRTLGLKVIFLVLLLQCIIIVSLLMRFSNSGLILGLSILLAIAFFAKFFYSYHSLLYNFPYAYFLPALIFPFVGVGMYTWFESVIRNRKISFSFIHILPFIPSIIYGFLLVFNLNNFYLEIVNNNFSGFIITCYAYGLILHFSLNYRLKKYIAQQIAEIPDLTYRFYQAVQTNLYFSTFVVIVSGITAWQNVDIKFIIDWMENLLWIGIGIVIIYYEWFFFSNLYADFNKNNKHKVDYQEEDSWAHLKQKLNVLMIDKKVYTNPNLTLSDLAGYLGTNNHYVSKLINEGFKKNYTDYINSFRVEAFIKLTQTDKENSTYLSTAYKVGFNSKSAFNRAFKKVTGSTPSEYFSENRRD